MTQAKRKPGPNTAFANYTTAEKYRLAAEEHIHDGVSQYQLATKYAISRARLNGYIKEHRAAIEAKAQAAPPGAGPLGLQESRRIGTFEEWEKRYFSWQECFDCGVRHEMPWFHKEIAQAIEGPDQRIVVNMPPGHSKSTLISMKHSAYQLCKDPNHMRIIVSKSGDLADAFLGGVKEYFTNRELYGDGPNMIDDWGPFKSDDTPWSAHRFFVAGRQSAEKDPSLQALGYGNQIYGRRAHDIVFDDIADVNNQSNPDQVTKMMTWIDKEAASRIAQREGKAVWVGTRVFPGDVYSLLRERQGYQVLEYPCIMDEQNEETLWPEHFPFSVAEIRRAEMTDADWQLVYQQVSVPGASAAFLQEDVDAAKDAERIPGHHLPHWKIVCGLDPAGGTKKSGYSAFVALAVDLGTGRRYVVDAYAQKGMRAPQIKQKILEWSDQYNPVSWRIEGNALQAQIFQYDTELVQELAGRGIRLENHVTGSNKWDSSFGISSTSPLFAGRLISIPWCGKESAKYFRPFTEQLTSWPMTRTFDIVMAFWFAELGIRQIIKRGHLPLYSNRRVPRHVAARRMVIDFGSDKGPESIPIEQQTRQLSRTRGNRLLTGSIGEIRPTSTREMGT